MSRPLALGCPLCGGVVAPPLVSRRVVCGYCSRPLLYTGGDFMPRYALPPKLDDAAHHRICQKLFRHPLAPAGLGRRAVLVRKRRMYLPFYLLTGKRGGILAVGKERIVAPLPGRGISEQGFGQGGMSGARFQLSQLETAVEEDSRVVVGDFRYLYAAAALEGREIFDTNLRDAVMSNVESAKPTTLAELSMEGDVIDPDIPLERLIEKGVSAGKETKGGLELLEFQAAIVYSPVVTFTFRAGQQAFSLTLDELTGRLLEGQMPFRKEWATLLSVPIVAGLGFIFGNLAAILAKVSLHEWAASPGTLRLAFIAGLLATAALAVGLQAAWLLMRTPFILKVTPAGPRVERAGPAPRNPFAPANALLKFVIESASKGKGVSRWEE